MPHQESGLGRHDLTHADRGRILQGGQGVVEVRGLVVVDGGRAGGGANAVYLVSKVCISFTNYCIIYLI